jgi:hypothetical protein
LQDSKSQPNLYKNINKHNPNTQQQKSQQQQPNQMTPASWYVNNNNETKNKDQDNTATLIGGLS